MTLSRKLATLLIEKNLSVDEMVKALQTYNLMGLLPSILSSAKQMASVTQGSTVVKIESPFPLSVEAITHIKKVVGSEESPHQVTITTSLLAGFKARFKGILYDGSAERIIRQLTH